MQMKMIKTNGINIRAHIEGSGPLIILVHGCPESWYSWRKQIGSLANAGYTVVAIDVRGYGGSDKPHAVSEYSLKKLADDILEKKNNKSEESIPSKIKKEIITIGDSRYEVEYIDEENNSQSIKNPPGKKILSPIEGRVFLTKDSKDTAVKENDIVKKGDIICYIESMKVINAIKSEYSGKILKIYFNEGDDVFDDDILFIIN